MKLSSSLYTHILLAFFANLLIVLALILCFFLVQTHSNPSKFFAKASTDRLAVAARVFSHRLSQTPQDEWSSLLRQHANDFRIGFIVVLPDGEYYTSDGKEVPKTIVEESTQELSQLDAEYSQQFDKRFRNNADNRHGHERSGRSGDRESQRDQDDFFNFERLMLHSDSPNLYWFGISLWIDKGHSKPAEPAMLFAVSTSRTGDGFFFNPYPWIIMAGLLILISLLLWIPLVKKITNPLQKMAAVAEEVAKGRFDVRVDARRHDEIGKLAKTINHMIARLGILVKGQKRFLGDISHELGSPIARIQFGLAALEQRLEGDARQRVRDIGEDVTDMAQLVNELLSFSRAENDRSKVMLKSISLLPVVQEVVRKEKQSGTTIQVVIDSSLVVSADDRLLIRALGNIVRNSMAYAGTHGPIVISARTVKEHICIEIQDNGPGVEAHLVERLFEPFFRVDESRSKETGGVGLGLSIVKTCIHACRGSVTAKNIAPSGFSVTIMLNKSHAPIST